MAYPAWDINVSGVVVFCGERRAVRAASGAAGVGVRKHDRGSGARPGAIPGGPGPRAACRMPESVSFRNDNQ